MKRSIASLLLCTMALSGCSGMAHGGRPLNRIHDTMHLANKQMKGQWPIADTETSSIDTKLQQLRSLWAAFQSTITDDKNPTEDFKNSAFLAKMKAFLQTRDSITIPAWELGSRLSQSDLYAIEKEIKIGETNYQIRVIGYSADYYGKALTDCPLENKWIFIQCWTEDSFYFKTILDGGTCYLTDFIPMELDSQPAVVLIGQESNEYPYSVFLWTFVLQDTEFLPVQLAEQNQTQKAFLKKGWFIENAAIGLIYISKQWNEGSAHERSGLQYQIGENNQIILSAHSQKGGIEMVVLSIEGNIFNIESN